MQTDLALYKSHLLGIRHDNIVDNEHFLCAMSQLKPCDEFNHLHLDTISRRETNKEQKTKTTLKATIKAGASTKASAKKLRQKLPNATKARVREQVFFLPVSLGQKKGFVFDLGSL